MAIVASLFAVLGRFVGRILTMALGWATILLFGRVPQSKQVLLSVISFGSLAWIAVLIGVLVPDAGALLLAAAPIPDPIQPYVHILLIVAAVVLPLGVGVGGFLMLGADDRPKGALGIAKQILRGYPYAAAIAVTLAFLTVVAPLRKLRSLSKRWEDAHIPVVVKPGGYERVATDLEQALDAAGLGIERRAAPRVLEIPSKLLAAVAGGGVQRLVPDRLIVLGNADLEVLIHPSDVAMAGKKEPLAQARAAVATRLTFTAAYLTSTEEAQKVEDALAEVAAAAPGVGADGRRPAGDADATRLADAAQRLTAVDGELARLVVPYEEWEVLYRLRLQVERDLLAQQDVARGEEAPAAAPGGAEAALSGGTREPASAGARGRSSGSLLVRLWWRSPLPRLIAALRRRPEPRQR